MSALSIPCEEAFARALAMGLSRSAASTEAGYGRRWKRGRERVARPDIAARARELGEDCEVSEVINALMRLARKAGDMPTAAAMSAARGLLAEAAKLKGRLGDKAGQPFDDSPIDARFMPLSEEDWIAKHVPRG